MSQFKTIASFFSLTTLRALAFSVFSIDYVKEILIDLSQEKLGDGQDSEGVELHTDKSDIRIGYGIYSPNNQKNYDQDFVDLYVSGAFYRSFNVVAKKTFFELKANFKKEEGKNIYDNFMGSYSDRNTFEDAILNLREEDMKVFIEKVFVPAAVAKFIEMVLREIK